ncbi:MAG: hypothetical protein VKJ04_07430 [Vampirovibrionales bacterium]|nr:hypothetical protein [Vampirovibrionales bacterium]
MNLPLLIFVAAISLISLGGGIYEMVVIDPVWPSRPEIIQPNNGGISRKVFWIPMHGLLEILLLISLFGFWYVTPVKYYLVIAFALQIISRLWSSFDFIPKALMFERGEQTEVSVMKSWVLRSRWRILISTVISGCLMQAVISAITMA